MESNPQNPQASLPGEPNENRHEPRLLFEGLQRTQAEIDEIKRQRELQAEAERKQWKREQWLKSEEGKLCLELYQKFQQYKSYVQRYSPSLIDPGAKAYSPEHQLFKEALELFVEYEEERAEQRRKNLARAHLAARCEHLHADGRRCGSPRRRGMKLCYKHQHMQESGGAKLDLGPMEDPESIQLAILKLQRAIVEGVVDSRQSGQLTRLLQLAAMNAKHMTPVDRVEDEELEVCEKADDANGAEEKNDNVAGD